MKVSKSVVVILIAAVFSSRPSRYCERSVFPIFE
jgi:hypothetical protein